MRYGRMLLVGMGCLALVACGAMRVDQDGELPGRFADASPTIVIAEPELTYGADPVETFTRAADLVAGFTEMRVPVVAPWELDVPAGQPWPHGRSATMALMGQHTLDPDDVLVARLVVEHDGATRAVVTPASMGGGIRVFADVDVTVRLELTDAVSREVLHTVTVTYREDPTRPGVDEFDLRPMLRDAIQRAARAASTEVLAARGLQAVDIPLPDTRWGAWHALEYGGGVGPSPQDTIDTLDGLDADVARFNAYRRYDPAVDSDLVAAWDRDRGGLLVVDPDGWDGLRAGDRILTVDGRSAAGRHALVRAAIRAGAGGAVELDVVGPDGRRRVTARPQVRASGPGATD